MIESIEFTNFKALRNVTLPLAPFTLLLGPNGSGKTTVLQALRHIAALPATDGNVTIAQVGVRDSLLSVTAEDRNAPVEVKVRLRFDRQVVIAMFQWQSTGHVTRQLTSATGHRIAGAMRRPRFTGSRK